MAFFTVPDACTSGGHLDVSALQHLGVSHRVLMLEFSIHNIRKNLELPVRVSSKSGTGFDPVLIEDTQVSETHVIIISI